MKTSKQKFLKVAHWVLKDELRALHKLDQSLDETFNDVCEMIINCTGRIIFCGVGHSGHVANKSAANMTSLNRPAYFLHAGEAAHGDLGLVTGEDLVIFISNSGETAEILFILPQIMKMGAKTIAIVNHEDSTLGRKCNLVLPIGGVEEAGPIKFAGSSTALNSMALCDALVMAIADYQNITEKEYFRVHPGGHVGETLKKKCKAT